MNRVAIVACFTVAGLTLRWGVAAEQPAASKSKTSARRPSEQVVDLLPELATHQEAEPLSVEFERLTALRVRPDGTLRACDAGTKLIKQITPTGQLVDPIPH